MTIRITKGYLREAYVAQQKSEADIARESGWSRKAIKAAVERFGLIEELTGTRQGKVRMKMFNDELAARLDTRIEELREENRSLEKRLGDNQLRNSLARIAEAQGHHYYHYWHNDEAVEITNLHKNRKWCADLGIPVKEVDVTGELDAIAAEG